MTSKRFFAVLTESRRWVTDPPVTTPAAKKPATPPAAVRATTKHLNVGPAGGRRAA